MNFEVGEVKRGEKTNGMIMSHLYTALVIVLLEDLNVRGEDVVVEGVVGRFGVGVNQCAERQTGLCI